MLLGLGLVVGLDRVVGLKVMGVLMRGVVLVHLSITATEIAIVPVTVIVTTLATVASRRLVSDSCRQRRQKAAITEI